jgi:hypothetical protein
VTEDEIRDRATGICDALVAGQVDPVIGALSDELRRNVGEVLALLPVPASEASVASVQVAGGGAAYVVVLDLTSETEHVEVQTRWKDRGGEPRIVEVSHLSRTAREAAAAGEAEGVEGAEGEAGPARPEGSEAGA